MVKDQEFKFDPDHVSDPPAKTKQRSHPMQLRSTSVNEISHIDLGLNVLNIGQLLQNNSVLTCMNMLKHN